MCPNTIRFVRKEFSNFLVLTLQEQIHLWTLSINYYILLTCVILSKHMGFQNANYKLFQKWSLRPRFTKTVIPVADIPGRKSSCDGNPCHFPNFPNHWTQQSSNVTWNIYKSKTKISPNGSTERVHVFRNSMFALMFFYKKRFVEFDSSKYYQKIWQLISRILAICVLYILYTCNTHVYTEICVLHRDLAHEHYEKLIPRLNQQWKDWKSKRTVGTIASNTAEKIPVNNINISIFSVSLGRTSFQLL